jgi:putative ABC transport system substrate-binding protein
MVGSTAGVLAVQTKTQTIPILMFSTLDPVALGVAKSISRPGRNVTGIWTLGGADDALISKRLEILKEFVPSLTRLGVVIAAGDPSEEISLRLLTAAAQGIGVVCQTYDVRNTGELEAAFSRASKEGVQAMFVNQNSFLFSRRAEIAAMAASARLPAIYGFREHAEAGGLVAYGASLPGAYRQSARLVDKILKGGNPADLPIEQPTTFELVINLKTAKALGLAMSPTLLARADAVIE